MPDFGELVPTGGGETIALMKDKLTIGRNESCDIVLRFPNVSSQHARMTLLQGYWFIKDLESRNGTKVDGFKITSRKRLDPGCNIAFAKHVYTLQYNPEALGAMGTPPSDDDQKEDIARLSLLDSAGLNRRDNKNIYKNRTTFEE